MKLTRADIGNGWVPSFIQHILQQNNAALTGAHAIDAPTADAQAPRLRAEMRPKAEEEREPLFSRGEAFTLRFSIKNALKGEMKV